MMDAVPVDPEPDSQRSIFAVGGSLTWPSDDILHGPDGGTILGEAGGERGSTMRGRVAEDFRSRSGRGYERAGRVPSLSIENIGLMGVPIGFEFVDIDESPS